MHVSSWHFKSSDLHRLHVSYEACHGMAPAFAILASNDAAAKVASKNSAAAGVQLFQPLGWHILACHTATPRYIYIYIIIYIHSPGPCFDLCLLLYRVGESCCFLAGVKGIQVKNWICSSWDIRISILHDNILHNCINAYILLYFRKPFHQLCFCPPRMFSSTSALLGLSRSADYSASNANLLLGFASQIVGGQNWLNL